MAKDSKGPDRYVRQVTEDTLSYVQSLQQELATQRDLVKTLTDQNEQLKGEVAALRADIDKRGAELISRYTFVEKQNANLANLYVASYRLHETVVHDEVLEVIKEILANLIGSEEVAVFERSPDGERVLLSWSSGLEAERVEGLAMQDGFVRDAIRSGEMFLSSDDLGEPRIPEEAELTACIPLTLNGQVTGAIAVFRLLSHKPSLTGVDHELFELLATHAATALYCARLHAAVTGTDSPAAPDGDAA